MKLKEGETLMLDAVLDRSLIEVFTNGRQAVTQVVIRNWELETNVDVQTAEVKA
jgi:hypothetical protein